MSHPAYPSRRKLDQEASTDNVVATWQAERKQLRDALQTAFEAIAKLSFDNSGYWPARGYDRDTTLETLREMMPDTDPDADKRMEHAAAEWVDDNAEYEDGEDE